MNKKERTMKKFQEFLEENGDGNMGQEELSKLLRQFNKQNEFNDDDASMQSDDYLEMAYDAEYEKDAIKYVKKALKLDPNNTDAESYLITLTSKNIHELLSRYEEALHKCKKQLKEQGYFTEEYKGVFWGVIETRPFIRLWYRYIEALIDTGMMNRAIEELKELLIWNEHDNCGGRYYLAHLYAYKQDQEALFDLHKMYGEYNETQFLLPISILFYKNNDLKNATKYLKKLEKCNPDIKIILNPKKIEKKMNKESEMIPGAYRPGTYQELLVELDQFIFLFDSVPYYFGWVDDILNKRKK